MKVSKDKDGIVDREILTRNWTDWFDYWAVDFDFKSKREQDPESGEVEEKWSGDYIFANEWQKFPHQEGPLPRVDERCTRELHGTAQDRRQSGGYLRQ